MRISDFVAPDAGTLVPTINRQRAFVPAPLPPRLDLAEIALPLADAMLALGELKGACRRLQNPFIIVRPLQRNEALTSSAMEGTFTTDGHLLLAEAGLDTQNDESTREVVNYLDALNESLQSLEKLPISHRVIKRAHEILLSGLSLHRGAQKRPGEYKREQNWIGGVTIEAARFVPPPPAETQTCMDDLERYINRDDRTVKSALIDLALVHYQIETIHPFSDGNGRVGRMLIPLMAVHSGLLDMPILYISPAMERFKDEYIDRMYNVSAQGNWSAWIVFFCERVSESCRETVKTIDRLISLQAHYRELAGNAGRSVSAMNLIDILFERPAISVTDAAAKLNITYAAARKTIDRLVGLNILTEFEGHYPKFYYSPEILHASRPDDQSTSGPGSEPPSGSDPAAE